MPLHLWLCKKNLYGKDFRKTSESVWRFESVHGFASVGNLYQKMHFAGSNLSTDPKCPKCIYKILKNYRVEKSGEISRNLRFSRFFVPASKSDTHHVSTGQFRRAASDRDLPGLQNHACKQIYVFLMFLTTCVLAIESPNRLPLLTKTTIPSICTIAYVTFLKIKRPKDAFPPVSEF